MKLYHTTLKKNKDSILKKGLLASKIGIVYLSEKPNSWWQGDEYVTFEIDTKNLKNKLTTFNQPKLDEVLCWGNIKPDKLKLFEKR